MSEIERVKEHLETNFREFLLPVLYCVEYSLPELQSYHKGYERINEVQSSE